MTGADPDPRRAVAELYEAHPYPDHGVVSTVVARLVAPLVEERRRATGRRLRLLDAGCGTGEQTLGIAATFPDVDVVGADVTPRSVERARHHARRHGIDVTFEHLDLLEPEAGRFADVDIVVCVGVLHHLPDPGRALRNLAGMVAPGARLLGMVYGRFGKFEMFGERDALATLSGTDDRSQRLALLAGIRRGRSANLLALGSQAVARRRFGPDIAWTEAARRVLAGRGTAYLADSYTHAHELVFTWEEVAELVDTNRWAYTGWARRSGMPDRPEQLFSGRALARARALDERTLAAVYERIVRPANLYFTARRPEVGSPPTGPGTDAP